MITYEDAVKTAKEIRADINRCFEYEKGYVFSNVEDENYIGGSHAPVVIVKETGKAISMPQFVIDGTGEEIGDREVTTWQR